MDFKIYFIKITLPVLILFTGLGTVSAQNTKFPNPRQEKLLNEVKLLVWSVPNAEKVTVKLRIHKGSAFDQLGKEGTMALLANILFPDQVARDFFEEDLGGSLEIISNYDYLQINATADSDKILTVLETLANAVISPQIDKETAPKVIAAQLEKVKELENDPSYLADLAVSKRLLGNFPYGRAKFGTKESLSKIDFADVIFARERFLKADNATLVVIGNVKSDLIYKAARRYFGGWTKSDEPIPATFRVPDAPEQILNVIETELENTSELRFAFRGLARNDKYFYASEILGKIIKKRLQKTERNSVNVKNNAHFLPGIVLIELPKWNLGLVKKVGNMIALPANVNSTVSDLFKEAISADEFNSAKNEVLSRFTFENLGEMWLDVDTYQLNSFKDEYQKAQNVTIENVKAVAGIWMKEPVASVLLFQNPKPVEDSNSSDH